MYCAGIPKNDQMLIALVIKTWKKTYLQHEKQQEFIHFHHKNLKYRHVKIKIHSTISKLKKVCLKVARLDFLGGATSQVWALTTSAWVKIWEKGYHSCIIWRWKFLIIWVLLQSELPWQHNDTITFLFIFVFLCTRMLKSLKGVCTCQNCLNYGKVWTNSIRAFWKYFETKFSES